MSLLHGSLRSPPKSDDEACRASRDLATWLMLYRLTGSSSHRVVTEYVCVRDD